MSTTDPTLAFDGRSFGRRRFIQIGAGVAVTALFAACSNKHPLGAPSSSTSTSTPPAGTAAGGGPSSVPSTPGTFGAPTGTGASAPSAKTLVIVQLNGGNDALNTLVPNDGKYRDARPTLALAEADLVALKGNDRWRLHPKLAPLTTYWESGTAAFLPGIGFNDPNHSHFVSLDRWWRADDMAAKTGWLGRSITDKAAAPLFATALGSGAPLLIGDAYQPAVVLEPAAFTLPAQLSGRALTALATPRSADPLVALAQASFDSTVSAVGSFADLLNADPLSGDTVNYREGGFNLQEGLALAARLITADVGARIVVVSAGGFDTHSNQLVTHAALMTDLAAGIDAFMKAITAGGAADNTLLVTTSEFGRRVAENASGGFDHGAGGMSMMFGPMVRSGVLTDIDLNNQLDGDVRPTMDPRTMYTACLDWLGADVEHALGKRYDEVKLLR